MSRTRIPELRALILRRASRRDGCTQREIQTESGASRMTVAKVFAALHQDAKIRSAVIQTEKTGHPEKVWVKA